MRLVSQGDRWCATSPFELKVFADGKDSSGGILIVHERQVKQEI